MSKKIYLFLAFLLTFVFLGCENKDTSTLKNVETIKLEKLLKQTSKYAEKEVVIDGNFFPACSDTKVCCSSEFVLKNGINQINVIKKGDYQTPTMKVALPIRVTGILKETAQSPFIHATKIELR